MIDSGYDSPGHDPKEMQDKQKIAEIVSKDGVRDTLRAFHDEVGALRGRERLFHITPEGLVVVLREGVNRDTQQKGYFKAWALDANASPKDIAASATQADLSYSELVVNRQVLALPSINDANYAVLREQAKLTEKEIDSAVPEAERAKVLLLKRTGGFLIKRGPHAETTTAGGQTLYPLQL